MSLSLCRRLSVIAGLLISAGCTTTTVDTYQRVPSARAEQAYLKPGVSFKGYKQLYPLRLEIYYPQGAAPTQEDLERIRAIFRTAFLKELAGDYRIASQPAPDALAVRASLVDLQSGTAADKLQLGGKLSGLVVSGQLTFFMELSDSMTGEVLARAADPDKPAVDPSSVSGGADSNAAAWARVETAAAHWATEFRSFLDEYLGH